MTTTERYEQKILGILENRSYGFYPNSGCYFRAVDRLFERLENEYISGRMTTEEVEEIHAMACDAFGI